VVAEVADPGDYLDRSTPRRPPARRTSTRSRTPGSSIGWVSLASCPPIGAWRSHSTRNSGS